jgi:hypothetical protein
MTEETKQKPKRLHPAGIILWGMNILAFFRMPKRIIEAHFAVNTLAWKAYLNKLSHIPFIEDQNSMGEFSYGRERRWLTNKLLGGRSLCAKENACEVIAVYNAELALAGPDKKPDFSHLLREFEKKGISFWGYFGTSFTALVSYFKRSPYEMLVYRGKQITREALQNAREEGFSACVMMAENKAGELKEMVHTICITGPLGLGASSDAAGSLELPGSSETKESEKVWTAHNDYEGSRQYATLEDAVFGYHKGQGRALGVILLKANK